MGSVSNVNEYKIDLVNEVHRLHTLGVRSEDSPNGGYMVHHDSE